MSDATADRIAGILAERLGTRATRTAAVAGGDINAAYRVDTGAGPVFVKTRADAEPGTYAQEDAGLRWLGQPLGGPPVARTVYVHDAPPGDSTPGEAAGHAPRFLALRWIERGALTPEGEERFGRELAALHAADCPAFGWAPAPTGPETGASTDALQIAGVSLPTRPTRSFAEFWAEQRVLPLAAQAHARGALSARDVALMAQLAERIPGLVGPREPPSRTHGDLWTGNLLADAAGRVHLIDPLAHGSHREVDLAMLRVFGGPSGRCFAAYGEAFPLADGHVERIPLMQLSIILLHVVLFGGSYAEQARRIARRYV